MSSSVRAEVSIVFIGDVKRQRKLVQHQFRMSLPTARPDGSGSPPWDCARRSAGRNGGFEAAAAIEGEPHEAEADELFQRALQLAPVGDLAEKIKNQQCRLADRVMRANAKGMPRMDAVMYLSSALEAYRALETEGQKQPLTEAAAVGQKGLAINDPDQMHQLRLYQEGNTISARQFACVYDVGVQLLLPGQDAGIDFAREYELAKGMAGGTSGG